MDSEAPIFETIYRDYLDKVNQLDLKTVASKIGAQWTGEYLMLNLFGKPLRISKNGILDAAGKEPNHSVKVVLFQYLLLHPDKHPSETTWISYKNFRDAAPLVHSFHSNVEMAIARNFEGRLKALKEACIGIGGCEYVTEMNYVLHMKFDALPKIPILLLFNDAEDEFPAQCILLFELRAEKYLDMECLAILGWLLADNLQKWSID